MASTCIVFAISFFGIL